MIHKDSLGNEDEISDGEVQWMTAGSGILHEEKLPASKRLLGVQLWLNMPKTNKMSPPEYHSIKREDIKEIPIDGGLLRLISGKYKEHEGFRGKYLPVDYYDIRLEANTKFTIDTQKDKSVMVFLLSGNAKVAGEFVEEKTAVKLTDGDSLTIESLDEDAEVFFVSSDMLKEPIAWGGPIVMNTEQELKQAFYELKTGEFLKEKVHYDK